MGGLFPIFRQETSFWNPGVQRMSAVVMALHEINDKNDGLHDDILPNFQVEHKSTVRNAMVFS